MEENYSLKQEQGNTRSGAGGRAKATPGSPWMGRRGTPNPPAFLLVLPHMRENEQAFNNVASYPQAKPSI